MRAQYDQNGVMKKQKLVVVLLRSAIQSVGDNCKDTSVDASSERI